jgi:hypothetical protein
MNKPSSLSKTNPVARNCRKFNKAVVHRDRKKAMARGYVKHGAQRDMSREQY